MWIVCMLISLCLLRAGTLGVLSKTGGSKGTVGHENKTPLILLNSYSAILIIISSARLGSW